VNILVTGGAGFIGSHLVETLLNRGHAVRVLDNFSSGSRDNLSTTEQLEVVEGDVRDLKTVSAAARDCHAIVHLAAVASVQASVEDPLVTHQVNFIGTLNLLETARQQGIDKFVFASSAAVYGNTETLPVSETCTPAPLTPYAADKLASEHYIDFYSRQHGLKPFIFRFFNVYGPRQNPTSPYSGVISIFIDRMLKGELLTLFGDGEQTRDFIYVADLSRLIADSLEQEAGVSTPLNVGCQKQTSLNQLLKVLRELTGRDCIVAQAPPRAGDIRHSLADTRLLLEAFGFRQEFSLVDGLKETLEWAVNQ